jgi:peptidylprolyl isomerase
MIRPIVAAAGALLLGACAHREPPLPANIPPLAAEPRTAFSLRMTDVAQGDGAPVLPRQCMYVHYTGWLRDGTKFDSSRDTAADGTPRIPIVFPQGSRRVIAGWEAGFEGLQVGGRRRLFIPYQLAYGELGRPPVIPPRAELIFDVEVMAVADTLPRLDPAAPAPRCAPWAEVQGAG